MLFVAKICRELEKTRKDRDIEPYLVKHDLTGANSGRLTLTTNNSLYGSTSGYVSYEDMIAFADGASQVRVRFGYPDDDNAGFEPGHVKPICGEIILPLADPREPDTSSSSPSPFPGTTSTNPPDKGAEIMQRVYWWLINVNWYYTYHPNADDPNNYAENYVKKYTGWISYDNDPLPDKTMAARNIATFRRIIAKGLEGAQQPDPDPWAIIPGIGNGAIREQLASSKWEYGAVMQAKGWGGAAIWYNKISELNGSLSAAVFNVPRVNKYPEPMEYVLARKMAKVQTIEPGYEFEPKLPHGDTFDFKPESHRQYADALWHGYHFWDADDSARTQITNNAFIDAINLFLGTDGLFNMRKNRDVHPLAQLSSVGRSLIQSAIRSLGLAIGSGVAGQLENTLGLGTGIFMTVATIGLTVGFVLFYVVPFLPFIYFFFALGGWVKGIFEAMVGAPLWALAHIRIDNDGLTGKAALDGYFLVLEVFLRPILIVFGLIASIATYSALSLGSQ